MGSLAGIGAKLRLGTSWIEVGSDKELTEVRTVAECIC